ncbi:glycosyltransferase, partial [Porticoccaceae bacterium]|nr:glycosyltransferase [Porticoccaceae bacterium]
MIGIVILNFNSATYVKSAAESIIRTGFMDFRLYVVDNFSSLQEAENIRNLCSIDARIEPITLSTNHSFSHGTNQGIKAALRDKCDFIHIFNPDVLVAANF